MTYAETSKRPLRTELQRRIDELKQENETLRARLRNALGYSETTVTELQRRIDELKQENETLRARLRNALNKLGLQ